MTAATPVVHELSAGAPAGPCIVLAHGLEDSWRTWLPLSRTLGADWRILALDLPWRVGNDYAWRWTATPGEWVAAGLTAVTDRPVLLVGHSFGANAALAALAAGQPDVAAAVVVAPFYRPAAATVRWKTFDASRDTFEQQIADGVRARVRPRTPADLVDLMLARTRDRIGPVGFLAAFDQYVASGHLPLGDVWQPVEVLIGELDPGTHPPYLAELAAALPRGRLESGADLDHFCHISRPEVVARAVRQAAADAGLPVPARPLPAPVAVHPAAHPADPLPASARRDRGA